MPDDQEQCRTGTYAAGLEGDSDRLSSGGSVTERWDDAPRRRAPGGGGARRVGGRWAERGGGRGVRGLSSRLGEGAGDPGGCANSDRRRLQGRGLRFGPYTHDGGGQGAAEGEDGLRDRAQGAKHGVGDGASGTRMRRGGCGRTQSHRRCWLWAGLQILHASPRAWYGHGRARVAVSGAREYNEAGCEYDFQR